MASPFKDDRPLESPDAGSREIQRSAPGTFPVLEDGDAHMSAGRFEEALNVYRGGLNRPGTAIAETVALKRKMAVALQSLARWEEAVSNLDEARDMAGRSGLASEEAQILVVDEHLLGGDHDHDHGDGEHAERCPHEPPTETVHPPADPVGHGSNR